MISSTAGIASRRRSRRSLTTDLSPSMSTSETFSIVATAGSTSRGTAMSTMKSGRCGTLRPSPRARALRRGRNRTLRSTRPRRRRSRVLRRAPASRRLRRSRHRQRVRANARIVRFATMTRCAPSLAQSLHRGPPHLAGADDQNGGALERTKMRTVPLRARPLPSRPTRRRCASAREPSCPPQALRGRDGASVRPSDFACVAATYASLTCPRISASPISIESRPGADAEEMLDRLMPELRVEIGLDVVTGRAVAEVRKKRFDLRDAAFVIVELGVDLRAARTFAASTASRTAS